MSPLSGIVQYTVLILFLATCGSNANECLTATTNTDDRRSPLAVLGLTKHAVCDSDMDSKSWIRFKSTAGTQIPEKCVETYRCSTRHPIWLSGSHPTAKDPGPVSRKVCAQNEERTNCCHWNATIQVKWCMNSTSKEEYFVYQLVPVKKCDMGYCVTTRTAPVTKNSCDDKCAWNIILGKCSCPKYPAMSKPPTFGEPYIFSNQERTGTTGDGIRATLFAVNCTIGYQATLKDDGARFLINIQADGETIHTAIAYSIRPFAVIHERFFAGHLGKTITMNVSSYWQSTEPILSPTMISNSRWFGIRPVDENWKPINRAVIKEGQTFTFRMQSTVPITGARCTGRDPNLPCNPRYTFDFTPNNQVKMTNCRFFLTPNKNYSDTIAISPVPTIGTRKSPFLWTISFRIQAFDMESVDSVFHKYKIGTFVVEIEDTKPRPICVSWGDPHIGTFYTNKKYDIYSTGDYYLVKAKNRHLEIQTRLFNCATSVSCNCGVFLREGNNLLGIDSCPRIVNGFTDNSPRLFRYLIDENAPGGTIEVKDIGWTIVVPSGVKIEINKGSLPGILDLTVTGLTSDDYTGLCSYSGSQRPCTTDCDAFKVPTSESLFEFDSTNPPKCLKESYIVPSCDCFGQDGENNYNVKCASPDQANLIKTGSTCGSSQNPDKSGFLYTATVKSYLGSSNSSCTPLWPTPKNKYTEIFAKDRCTQGITNSGDIYNMCQKKFNINIEMMVTFCVTDIQLMDDLSPAKVIYLQYIRLCLYKVREECSTQCSNKTDGLPSNFTDLICLNQCSNQGTCKKSRCVCKPGFTGGDCSVVAGKPPAIVQVWIPECRDRTKQCHKIYIQVLEFSFAVVAKCKFRNSQATTYDSEPGIAGSVIICSLPKLPEKYFISITIDGQIYSSEIEIHITQTHVTMKPWAPQITTLPVTKGGPSTTVVPPKPTTTRQVVVTTTKANTPQPAKVQTTKVLPTTTLRPTPTVVPPKPTTTRQVVVATTKANTPQPAKVQTTKLLPTTTLRPTPTVVPPKPTTTRQVVVTTTKANIQRPVPAPVWFLQGKICWESHAHLHVYGSAFRVAAFGLEADCRTACANDDMCIGAEWNANKRECSLVSYNLNTEYTFFRKDTTCYAYSRQGPAQQKVL